MSSLRRRFVRAEADNAEVNMTPMLDIVFIMLIFFIVTAVFLDETALDFTTPPKSNAPTSEIAPTILVRIDETNQISVEQEYSDLSGVGPRVQAALAEKPSAAILLMASYEANWDPVVSIKDQMEREGRPVVIEVTR